MYTHCDQLCSSLLSICLSASLPLPHMQRPRHAHHTLLRLFHDRVPLLPASRGVTRPAAGGEPAHAVRVEAGGRQPTMQARTRDTWTAPYAGAPLPCPLSFAASSFGAPRAVPCRTAPSRPCAGAPLPKTASLPCPPVFAPGMPAARCARAGRGRATRDAPPARPAVRCVRAGAALRCCSSA